LKTIKSLEKVCQIFDCFTEDRPEWSLTELSRVLAIPKTTLVTLMGTLCACGYLEKNEVSNRYSLGLRFFELGFVVRNQMEIRTYILPTLEELQQQTGEIVYLTVPRSGKALYLEAVYPSVRLIQYSTVGRLAYMHATGVGKAMLAHMRTEEIDAVADVHGLPKFTPNTLNNRSDLMKELDHIRQRGYAVDNEESELSIRCVAVPIRTGKDNLVGAISVSGPSVNFTPETIEQYATKVQQAVSQITRFAHLLPRIEWLTDDHRQQAASNQENA